MDPTAAHQRQHRAITLYLCGFSYDQVAQEFKVSRSRILQLIGPNLETRKLVWYRASGRCEDCQIPCSRGHIHHQKREAISVPEFNAPRNLLSLCLGCHRKAHRTFRPRIDTHWQASFGMQPNPRAPLFGLRPFS